jgi:hemolysin III
LLPRDLRHPLVELPFHDLPVLRIAGSKMVISDGRPEGVTWDYDRFELIADGILHVVGLLLAVSGAIAIIIVTARSGHAADTLSIVIYASALLSVLGLSAAYNMWPLSRAKWILRRFDHAAIYLLIAGTYTPFLAQMPRNATSVSLTIGIWLTAIIGFALKLLFPGRFERFGIALCLLLGWSGIVAYEPIAAILPSISLWLLVAGGVLYSAGVAFHCWESLRFQNAIWHGFVLAAASCHYAAVLCVALFSQA